MGKDIIKGEQQMLEKKYNFDGFEISTESQLGITRINKYYYDGFAEFESSRGKGIINTKNGKIIVPDIATDIVYDKDAKGFYVKKYSYSDGFDYGFYNLNGENVIGFIFSVPFEFYDERALVRVGEEENQDILLVDSGYNFIDGSGLPMQFDTFGFFEDAKPFENGYATVKPEFRFYLTDFNRNKWGVIDKNGNVVIPYEYDEPVVFKKCGHILLASVKGKNNLYGFINIKNELVIDYIYEDAKPFVNGLSNVKKEGKWGVIDSKGNEVLEFKYDEPQHKVTGYIPIYNNETEKYALYDMKTKKRTGYIFDKIASDELLLYFSGDFVFGKKVKKEGKWGIVDDSFNTLVPFEYSGFSITNGLVYGNTFDHKCIPLLAGLDQFEFEPYSLETAKKKLLRYPKSEILYTEYVGEYASNQKAVNYPAPCRKKKLFKEN